MYLKNTLGYLAVFLLISGVLSLLPVGVALYYAEDFIPLLLAALLSCLSGLLLLKKFKLEDLDFGEAMFLGALSFIVISLFGAIPFFMSLNGPLLERTVNSYFESVSGYTTTGLSIFPLACFRPTFKNYHSFIFRRTFSEWVGGLGVIILFLSILARGGHSTVYLYKLGEGAKRITPSVEHTARIIIRVYLFYTFIGAITLWIFSEDLFHSLTGIMSTLSTGGFIFLDQGFTTLLQLHPELMDLLALFMLIGAIPFTLHYFFFGGKLKKFFHNLEVTSLLWFLSLFTLLFILLGWLEIPFASGGIQLVHNSVIMVISALTTTGHPLPFTAMSDLEKFLLLILVLVGAGAGSTAGGIKLIRVAILSKAVPWLTRKSSLPETAILPLKIKEKVFEEKELREIALFFFIYLVLVMFSCFVLLIYNQPLGNALLLSASAQGTSSVAPIDVRTLPVLAKIVLIFQMIAGRLEIFPILALIGYLFGGAKKKNRGVKREELNRRLRILRKLRRV